jgi:uncharacterized repeat protein (TIGR02543 family)
MKSFSNLFFALIFATCTISFADQYREVPKKVGDCYQISTAQELNGFIGIVNGNFIKQDTLNEFGWYDFVKDSTACGVLTADIKLVAGEDGWEPFKVFSGTFDGNGHTISNLGVGGGSYFFDTLVKYSKDNPLVVKNVRWADAFAKVSSALVGETNGDVVLDHIYNEINCGFVLGQSGHLTISNSYNTGRISKSGGVFVGKSLGVVSLKNIYNVGSGATLVGYARDTVSVVNGFSIGDGMKSTIVSRYDYQGSYSTIEWENYYYLDTASGSNGGDYGEQFADGSIALKLRYMNDDGAIWGQNVGVDSVPNFSGKITGDHSSTTKVSKITVVSFNGDTTSYPKYYVEGEPRPFGYVPSQRDGYVFSGWFYNPKGAGAAIKTISDRATGDLTIYGKWWKIPKPKGDCYEIASMDDLFGFAAIVNGAPGVKKDSLACGKLVADIKYERKEEDVYDDGLYNNGLWWLPIQNFAGSFNGNGFTVSGLYSVNGEFYEVKSEPVGLFGSISGGSDEKPVVVKNLKIRDSYFYARWSGAPVVGRINEGARVVLDSIVVDMPHYGAHDVGGIVGLINGNTKVTLSNSSKIGETIGEYFIGGLVGCMLGEQQVTIANSFVDGEVTANHNAVGSIVGSANKADILISGVYAKGNVNGYSYMGGFVGSNTKRVRIENSYHIGDIVTGQSCPIGAGAFEGVVIGGFAGTATVLSIVNSYQLGTIRNECYPNRIGALAGYVNPENVHTDNVFFPTTLALADSAKGVAEEKFANGFVAYALHRYDNGKINGSIWGQEVGVDPYPVFKSKLEGFEIDNKISKLVLHTYEGDSLKYANSYMEGVETQLPIPYHEGHYFHGWFTNPEFTGDSIGVIPSTAKGELHYYANFEIKRFYIGVNIHSPKECESKVEGVGYHDYGSKVVLKPVTSEWCELNDSRTTFTNGVEVIDKVTESDTLDAFFTYKLYNITCYNDTTVYSRLEYTYVSGEKLDNYVWGGNCRDFLGWYDNEKFEGEPYDSVPNGSMGDKKFWAKFGLKDSEECKVSSSSVAKSSSSSVVKSSSSRDGGSSSSMTKPSSSSKSNSLVQIVRPNLKINVLGRSIQIECAVVGTPFAVLDMQGRVLQLGYIQTEHLNLTVARSGTYLVKIGSVKQLVRVGN